MNKNNGYSHSDLERKLLHVVSEQRVIIWPGNDKTSVGLIESLPVSDSGKEPRLPMQVDVKIGGFYPWVGSTPGGKHSNPHQYSCLENPMDRGPWQVTFHGLQRLGHN